MIIKLFTALFFFVALQFSALANSIDAAVIVSISSHLNIQSERVLHDSTLNSLGVDHLNLIPLIEAVEKKFGIYIQDGEIDEIETVSDLTKVVIKKLSDKNRL